MGPTGWINGVMKGVGEVTGCGGMTGEELSGGEVMMGVGTSDGVKADGGRMTGEWLAGNVVMMGVGAGGGMEIGEVEGRMRGLVYVVDGGVLGLSRMAGVEGLR